MFSKVNKTENLKLKHFLEELLLMAYCNANVLLLLHLLQLMFLLLEVVIY